MEFITKIANYLQTLNKKQVQQYFLIFLASVCVGVCGMIYFIHSKSSDLILEINRLEALASKSRTILEENQRMENEALRIQDMLDKEKGFDIKSYFESFCQQQGLANQGWSDHTEDINDKFDEISLSASFKGQTTEKLVKILEELNKKEIIYIKNLNVKQESDKKISFDITIATKAMKRGS